MLELPNFLQRYLSRNNLMMIYPEQFGEQPALTTFVDPLASDITATPSPLWSRMRYYRRTIETFANHLKGKGGKK
jgi:hypothetical protein